MKLIDPNGSMLIAACAGITAHLTLFIRGEWHLQGEKIIFAHVTALAILCSVIFTYTDDDFLTSLRTASWLGISYITSFLASIVCYRLFFHPLRNVLGPFLFKVSKLWHALRSINCENHQVLEGLHHKYGRVVRTGPNELTTFDGNTHNVINSPNSKCTKTMWYDLMHSTPSIFTARDTKVHEDRRHVWNKAFGPSALDAYENQVIPYVEKMEKYIARSAETKEPILANEICYWYAFDIMSHMAYGKSFGMLDEGQWHHIVQKELGALQLLGPFSPVMWLARLGLRFFPGLWRMRDWHEMTAFGRDQICRRINDEESQGDVASHLIEHAKKRGFGEDEKQWLYGDAFIIVIAKSDTTAASLVFLLYCLARYPKEAEILVHELNIVNGHDDKTLRQLPHLAAFINETMRLYPIVPTGMTRDAPPGGIQVGDSYVPPGTTMVAPRFSIARMEESFERPNEFLPSRWKDQPELVKNRHAFSPFSLGRYSCARRNLAMMELRLAMATPIKKYHVEFAPGYSVDATEVDMIDSFTLMPGPLNLLFKRRF